MLRRPLGVSGIPATAVGLGTYNMGGWMWGGTDDLEAVNAIRASIDAGINFIDTAPAYGLGHAEEIVGRAIAGFRQDVVLATKCGLVWHTDRGNYFFDENGKPVHRYLGKESVRFEVEQSLRRLQTDYIDLYQTHWQDPTTSIYETMDALLELKQEGKIRAIGVSNVTVDEIQQYQSVGQLDTDQEQYSMLDREIEAALLPHTRKYNIAMIAYSPLAIGLLTGKIGPERKFEGDDQRINNPRFGVDNRTRVKDMLDEFVPIAESNGLSIGQLVIAWTTAQAGVSHVLVGARNPKQAVENAAAGRAALTRDTVQAMDAVIERHSTELV